MRKIALFVLIIFGLVACGGQEPSESPGDSPEGHGTVPYLTESAWVEREPEFVPLLEPNYPTEFIMPLGVYGVGGADVRLHHAGYNAPYGVGLYRLLDLNEISDYHLFFNYELLESWDWDIRQISVAFTTAAAVEDFRILRLADMEVVYHLPELTPSTPLVIIGADTGGLHATQGFSFTEENGETRHFAFRLGNYGYCGCDDPEHEHISEPFVIIEEFNP